MTGRQEFECPVEAGNKVGKAVSDPEFGPWLAQASILIVDDEPGMRNFLVRIVRQLCKRIEEAAGVKEASRMLDEQHFDLVILDNIMPETNGLDWLAEQRAIGFSADVILMTAYADLDSAIEALRAGVVDFLLEAVPVEQAAECRCALSRSDAAAARELRAAPRTEVHITSNPLAQQVARRLYRDSTGARDHCPRRSFADFRIVYRRVPGTGKEIAARSLHAFSNRADKLFVPVNCGAIPADMIESELFGHLKGAFTGTGSAREGLFMHAQGGALLLDEIGELPYALQSKLLRVLEDRRVRPVGSEREIPFDARFCLRYEC